MVTLGQLSGKELDGVLEEHPWFTAARAERISRCCGQDSAKVSQAVAGEALWFNSRAEAVRILTGRAGKPAAAKEKPEVVIVGGDYFSREDYLEAGELPSAAARARSGETGSDGTVSETLAEIYVKQDFYQRAIDIYEKLILLYPEKSAYFATLIEKLKNKI